MDKSSELVVNTHKKSKVSSLVDTFKQHKMSYLFILPSILLILLAMVVPLIHSFSLSFFKWDGYSEAEFVGLQNYIKLLTDSLFWNALTNNLKYILLFATFTVVLGFLFAVAIDRRMVGWRIYKFVFFIPVMLITAVISALFAQVFEPNFGILNTLLKTVGLGEYTQLWLGNPNLTVYSIIAVAIWQITGWTMLLFLSSVEGIPTEIHDAATLDGVSEWQRILYITIPMVKRMAYVIIMLQIINSLKTFDLIWVMTQGGPNYASDVLGTILYRTAFSQQSFGYASAISVTMTVVVMIICAYYIKVSKLAKIDE
ncbi:sugar ABC transporter permease [Gracilibacillus sp. YIM 98692]|uniref:carbohydrate ABC transporter permease n=1 Tax=Gracilibacillus sp. YIM 98692 TaxID=2663532 RepID=UPI0013D58275|nr:sugar ABC transporter permease [Gracilibacillus sp. YIM 98692]